MNVEPRWELALLVTASLARLMVIAMLLERGLAFLFEYYWFRRVSEKLHGLRAGVALAVSIFVCSSYRFDVFAGLIRPTVDSGAATTAGIALTSLVVAGCSVAFMALFQGVFDWSKPSRDQLIRARQMTAAAVANETRARGIAAEALVAEAETRRLKAAGELAQSRAFFQIPVVARELRDRSLPGHTERDGPDLTRDGGITKLFTP